MMERLTKRDGILVHTIYLGDFGTANVLERLAEYEDTGLQPYHISDVLKDHCKLIDKCKNIMDENTELKRLLKSSIEHIKMLSDNICCTECRNGLGCDKCQLYVTDSCDLKWKFNDKALKILKGEENNV